MHNALLACSAFAADERVAMWAALERVMGQPDVNAQILPAHLSSNSQPCWGTPSGAPVLRLWMLSSSSTWLHKRGGGGAGGGCCAGWCGQQSGQCGVPGVQQAQRCGHYICCCAIAATGGDHTRCLVPALPSVSDGDWVCPGVCPCAAPAGSIPARLLLPLPAAAPGPLPTMMWLARCVLASTVQPQCCCAKAATGGSTCSTLACAGSACPLGTGTARPVLDPLLEILLPLLAALAAARRPMALALRSVYEHWYYFDSKTASVASPAPRQSSEAGSNSHHMVGSISSARQEAGSLPPQPS
jgi:hypothetical protein